MPNKLNIEVVPVREVPPPKADHAVNGLEAWFVDDGKIPQESLGQLGNVDISFEVRGRLPRGERAWIIQSNGTCQLMRQMHHDDWEWLGEFPGVQDSLLALSNQLSRQR